MKSFIGKQQQIPPIYSAIKVNGKKLYELARKGKNIERKARKVSINKLELISFDEENSDLAEEITAKTIEIQDKTIFYLKSKNIEDFKASNEVKLKQDLMAQINTVLTKGELVNIYFPAGLMLQK